MTYSPLDRREIWLPRSKPNSEHSHCWELQKHVGAKRNTLRTVPFSFPAETQNGLSKTTIPVSLTVGFSFNLDMLHNFTVGICEIIFLEGEKWITWRQYKWRLQSLLRLSNVWELYQSSWRKNWKNLRKPLEMPLWLSKYTWVCLEVRDEFVAIGG